MTKLDSKLALVTYLALYVMADQAALAPQGVVFFLSPWDAAPALSFAFALRYGLPWLPAFFLAPLISHLLDASLVLAPDACVLRALCETAAIIAAPLLAGRGLQASLQLNCVKSAAVFMGVGIVAALLLTAASFAQALYAAPPLDWTLQTAFELFTARLVAILCIAPLILAFPGASWFKKLGNMSLPRFGEALLQAGTLLATAWEVFGRFLESKVHFFYLLFLPIAWIASRHGQIGAGLALWVAFLVPMLTGAFFGQEAQAILGIHIRLGVLAVTSLILAALVAERRLAEARTQARQAELAHFQRVNVGWEMASALAHELSQPLTAAMNLAQASQRLLQSASPDPKRAAEIIGVAIDKIERAGEIIHGLREFMRKGKLELIPNDMRDILDDALRLASAEIHSSGAVVHTPPLVAYPKVRADKTQMVQVLINLIRNALQAMAQAKAPSPKIAVSIVDRNDMIEVVISDNGPGLPTEVMDRLFEPFVTTKASGMGLGLSISKSIMEAHNGRLWAENIEPEGAAFHVLLPVAEDRIAHD